MKVAVAGASPTPRRAHAPCSPSASRGSTRRSAGTCSPARAQRALPEAMREFEAGLRAPARGGRTRPEVRENYRLLELLWTSTARSWRARPSVEGAEQAARARTRKWRGSRRRARACMRDPARSPRGCAARRRRGAAAVAAHRAPAPVPRLGHALARPGAPSLRSLERGLPQVDGMRSPRRSATPEVAADLQLAREPVQLPHARRRAASRARATRARAGGRREDLRQHPRGAGARGEALRGGCRPRRLRRLRRAGWSRPARRATRPPRAATRAGSGPAPSPGAAARA